MSLGALAERVGLSGDHLGARFRKEIGMTPVEYRTRLRLLRARELLVSTTLNVAQIAREVGFLDANYFTRLFRRSYRMTPRRFARTHTPG